MEKDNIKEFKQTRLIIVLVAIIIVLVFALGFVLGTKNNKILINPDTTKETKETKKEKEEIVKDSKPEEEIIGDTVDEELAKKAFRIIPTSYNEADVLYEVYLGKKVDLTKLKDSTKMSWLLSTLPSDYKIPFCASREDLLEVSEEDLLDNSFFEDNSFIANSKKDNSGGSYFAEYKNGKIYVGNSNCDGRGTGATAFELFEYDSNKIHDNTLELFVRFGYFEPSIEDYEKNYFAYDIKDSYAKNAKTLKKDFDGEIDYDSDNNLLNISHAIYKFTFKIEGEKLYPLTVEMN